MTGSESDALSKIDSYGWNVYGGIKFCITGKNQYVAIRPAVYNGSTGVLVFKLEDWKAMLADMPTLIGEDA
jgi:hypothetical protein